MSHQNDIVLVFQSKFVIPSLLLDCPLEKTMQHAAVQCSAALAICLVSAVQSKRCIAKTAIFQILRKTSNIHSFPINMLQ